MSELTEEQRALLVGPDARMQGYYVGFDKTGNELIDQLLSAVAFAAKGAHSTDAWGWRLERDYGPIPAGKSFEWLIQAAANDAAERLAAASVTQPEPEYEYQWGHPNSDFNSDFFGYDPYPTYEEALADMREDGDPLYVVVRRVKAGAWEPVPNQTGETP